LLKGEYELKGGLLKGKELLRGIAKVKERTWDSASLHQELYT
jgi:hypothetical protein